jgi:hypothetical protein
MAHEVKWSCGCHEVDGVLVSECTQVAPTGEISAERHGVLKPFAAKCGRKAALALAESARVAEEAAAKAEADHSAAVAAAKDAAAKAAKDAAPTTA